MATQLRTLTYPNNAAGQQKKIGEVQAYLNNGWEIVSENITSGSFDANSAAGEACCYGIICAPVCMPLALMGKTKEGQIVVTIKKEFTDVDQPRVDPLKPAVQTANKSSDPNLANLPLPAKVEPGDSLPFFSLQDQHGNIFRTDEIDTGYLVLAFYHKDMGMGYSMFVKNFQKLLGEFEKYNAMVVGIGEDSAASHQSYAAKHGITYPLLVDTGAIVSSQMKAISGIQTMCVIVYNKSKKAILSYANMWNAEEPAKQAIRAIVEDSARNDN